MLQAIAVALLILYAAIAWVILRGYRNTRNIGFLIIGCGVLVWPLVSSLFDADSHGLNPILIHQPNGPRSLIRTSFQAIYGSSCF